jgi:ABC-type multidrug transport system fused ATPase/permease subunit
VGLLFTIRNLCLHSSSPQFAIPGIVILVGGIWIGQIYIQSQLSIKREMSNARSPLFSHFGTALTSITSIRAYGVQDHFKNEAMKRIDKYTRTARTFYNLNVSKQTNKNVWVVSKAASSAGSPFAWMPLVAFSHLAWLRT